MRSRVSTFEFDQKLAGGMNMPATMSVLPTSEGKVALVSPIPIDDALEAKIRELGDVEYLIAPNLLHHLYLEAATKRFPKARVLGPRGLDKKQPNVKLTATLDETPDVEGTTIVNIEGAPALEEAVFFHRASNTLVVTELLFNVKARGLMAHIVFFMMGVNGKLAQSRAWRFFAKDQAKTSASVERVLALPFERLVLAHGASIDEGAHAKAMHALRWLIPSGGTFRLPPSGDRARSLQHQPER